MTDKTSVTIYGLRANNDGVIRYVGQTAQRLRDRLYQHRAAARAGKQFPVCDWIRAVGTDGFDIVELEQVARNQRFVRERHWIEQHGTLTVDGGLNEFDGDRHSSLTIAKKRVSNSVAALKRWEDPVQRAAKSAERLEFIKTPAGQAMLSNAGKIGGRVANHKRYHVAQCRSSLACVICTEGRTVESD